MTLRLSQQKTKPLNCLAVMVHTSNSCSSGGSSKLQWAKPLSICTKSDISKVRAKENQVA